MSLTGVRPPKATTASSAEQARTRKPQRWLAVVLAGGVLGVLAYAVFADARCPAAVTLTVAVLLVCVVPSGRAFSRRIALNGLVALGLLPLLWMPSGLRSVNHGALALALVLALLLIHLLLSDRPRDALSTLVPSFVPADLLLLPSGVAATVWGWHLFTVRTPTRALEALLPGYDHAGHYDIFAMTWSRGVFVDALGPAPDGSRWTYGNYPAGFHADAASLAQLTAGLRPRSTEALVTYAHLDAALVVVGTIVVTACLISAFRRPLVLALLPPLAVMLTALLWLPGGQVLWHGFENFWLAAVFATCSLFLAARSILRGEESLGGLLAVLAATVGTALNWLPLGSVCWLGPVVVFWVYWRDHAGLWRARLLGVLTCAVALVIVLRTVVGLRRAVPISALVTASGGIQSSPLGPIILVLVLVAVITIALGRLGRSAPDPALRQVRWVGAALVTGWALTGVAVAAQQGAGADYYATKLTLGVLVVSGCWLAFLLAVVLDRVMAAPAGDRRTVLARVLAVLVLCLLATQLFGHMSLARATFEADRGVDRDQSGRRLDYHAMSQGILAAASATDHEAALRTQYVAIGDGRWYVADLPNTWFHSLTASLTARTSSQSDHLHVSLFSSRDAVGPVRAALRADSSLTVLVDPARANELHALLDPTLAGRVLPWTSRP